MEKQTDAQKNLDRALRPVVRAAAGAVLNSPELSALAEDAQAFEARMAPRLGGEEAAEVRTMLGYCIGRLVALGAEPDAIDEYVSGVLAQLRAASVL